MNRGDLTDAHWDRLQPLLPPQRHGKGTKGGRPSINHRQIINGILWILRTGAPWEDLPARYGKRSTVSTRYYRWIEQGIWDRIYDEVKAQADARGVVDWEVHHGDATVVRAHQHAAGAKRGTGQPRRWGAVKEASAPRFI
jgi:transposase